MTIEEKREQNRIKNKAWREKDREAYNRNMREWKSNNPHKTTCYKLKSRYGITPEQYNEMLIIQNNCCAICGNEETAINVGTNKIQKLAVDHCHRTGKVRGLLCQDCNRGIGKFHDDISRLKKAIEYLEKYNI